MSQTQVRTKKPSLGFSFLFALLLSVFSVTVFSTPATATSWTELARKVGESEDDRARTIAKLRKITNLKSQLKKAIYTKDRPLALDVISALELKDLVSDLLFHVPADPDGFLTVAINAMMDASNQQQILKSYLENLQASSIPKVSSAAQVAMLEPVGRLGVVLSRETISALQQSTSPEVRSSVLYYVRIMALRNKHFEWIDELQAGLRAPEFQLRLQAVSIGAELLASSAASKEKIPPRDQLKAVCENEKTPSIKSACLSFLAAALRAPAAADELVSGQEAAATARTCSVMQSALYSRPTMRIRMVFGYKDARPARFVGDRHERLAFIERVTSTCASGKSAKKAALSCGFVRSHSNADLFMKKLKIRGKERKILLWAVNSSVGTDDQENQADPFQKWKSKYAEEAFLTGLRDSDVVMYNGHSRFGGGPDFSSPKLANDGTVDPSSYEAERPGLTKMISSLRGTVSPKAAPFSKLKVLGLFSCSSSQHFNEEIHAVSKVGIVASKALMYYSDALNQSLATLDDVLKAKCPKAMTF